MSTTNVTTTTETTTVTVQENTVLIELNNVGIQGVPGANNDPTYVTVRNATGATLAKGTIVYISGANGNNVQVSPALATGDSTSARTIGWLAASIPNNGSGLCMVEGYLEGINTQGFTAGAQLYLSGTVAGAFTATKPVAPIHLVYVGVVTKVSSGDGHVFVKVQNGYELDELHNVLITSPTNNQVLAYDSATQLWKNATNAPDGVTSITATAPLTGGTITSTGSIGLDQTALSLTRSQITDFASGTVTSASTAQQAGTAVYSVNSGTAVYATTSGTAVTISGDITKSQVSDFTSGTVASASTAQQAGTAVFADTSGTATYATTSGTATYADTSGTAVFATNASTAVTISGSIAQSQVTGLVTALAGKANLAGGNAFTGSQTVTGTETGSNVLIVKGASGQSVDPFQVQASTGGALFSVLTSGSISATGRIIASGATGARLDIAPASIAGIGLGIRGLSGQTGNLLSLQRSDSTEVMRVRDSGQIGIGSLITATNFAINLDTVGGASAIGAVIRGAASQTGNLQEWQNSAGTVQARVGSDGRIYGTTITTLNGALNGSESGGGGFLRFTKATAASTNPGANLGVIYFRDGTTAGTLKLVVRAGASGAEETLFDNLDQTGTSTIAIGSGVRATDATVATASTGVGYMGLPQNTTTTGAYTIVAGDAGEHIYASATRTVTIPANSALALPIGTTLTFIAGAGATMTIAITTDTMYLAGAGTTGSRTLAAHGIATAVKTTATTWIISGNGLT